MEPTENRSGGRRPHWAAVGSRYIVALGALGGAVLFRYVFRDSLGFKVPYLQFYPAIIAAAWYGGLGPGLLTTALSAVGAMYFLLPPSGMSVSDSADQLSLGVFVATGVVISWRLRGSSRRARIRSRVHWCSR